MRMPWDVQAPNICKRYPIEGHKDVNLLSLQSLDPASIDDHFFRVCAIRGILQHLNCRDRQTYNRKPHEIDMYSGQKSGLNVASILIALGIDSSIIRPYLPFLNLSCESPANKLGTPLCTACRIGDSDMVEELLKAGANSDVSSEYPKDDKVRDPMSLAIIYGGSRMVNVLGCYNVKVPIEKESFTHEVLYLAMSDRDIMREFEPLITDEQIAGNHIWSKILYSVASRNNLSEAFFDSVDDLLKRNPPIEVISQVLTLLSRYSHQSNVMDFKVKLEAYLMKCNEFDASIESNDFDRALKYIRRRMGELEARLKQEQ